MSDTQSSVFSEFTNLYSLTKTLRFELRPVGETQQMLEDNKIFEVDKKRQENYLKIKPYFDQLHNEFFKESVTNIHLDYSSYQKALENWQKDKKNGELKKSLENYEKKLRVEIEKLFKAKNSIRNKPASLDSLFKEEVFDLLKLLYGQEPETGYLDEQTGKRKSIFDDWKGFTGYFDKFQETRKNLYKTDGTSTAFTTRIVNQNLKRFCDNLAIFNTLQSKGLDFSEVENNLNVSLADVFRLSYYNKCVIQADIDIYNSIIGGKTLQSGKKLVGINEVINKYKQDNPNTVISYLKLLEKQILSEKTKEDFVVSIESDDELKQVLGKFYQYSVSKTSLVRNLFKKLFSNNINFDLSKVYFSKEALNTIRHKWTGETVQFELELQNILKTKENREFYKILGQGQLDKMKGGEGCKFPDFVTVNHVKLALENINNENFWKERYYKTEHNGFGILEKTTSENIWQQFLLIFELEFSSLFSKEVKVEVGKTQAFGYDLSRLQMEQLIQQEHFQLDPKIIKDFADSTLWIYQMAKYFAVEKKREWLESFVLCDEFYQKPETGYRVFYTDAYKEIVQNYNLIRNYLTKKLFSEDKWKLNFNSPSLAKGWDSDLENQRRAIVLRDEKHKYYLAVLEENNNHIFDGLDDSYNNIANEAYYEKMIFKQQVKAFRQLPRIGIPYKLNAIQSELRGYGKVDQKDKGHISDGFENFQAKNFQERAEKYGLTKEVLQVKDLFDKFQDTKTKNDKFDQQKLQILISYYKKIIEVDYSLMFDVQEILEKHYTELNKFYEDFEKAAYSLKFIKISRGYIDNLVKDKKMYLFEIYNKDLSTHSKGVNNLHSLYFKALFASENLLSNKSLQLGANAEIFFRPKSKNLEKKHKIDDSGKLIFKGKTTEKVLINERYLQNKVFFHCPIVINAVSEEVGAGFKNKFDQRINNFLANNPEINIIGVDRGEKHLAYYTVINQKGEILRDKNGSLVSGSLNFVESRNNEGELILKNGRKIEEIKNEQGDIMDYKIVQTDEKITHQDYKLLLDFKEKKRKIQRQTWDQVENIKDLKKGYISQVVRKLADLVIEHNAIIVFEDLNMRFKQIRSGIEKSIYQQLEKALISKLNFLVDKGEKDLEKAGNLLKAFQLTAPFETFKDMGKQTGIIFYTQASYTSKIDPLTGWRPNLYLKYSGNNKLSAPEKAKEDILKFDKIQFTESRFEFTYNLKKFIKSDVYPQKTEWTVCSCVERYRWDKTLNLNKGGYKHYKNLTVEFQQLFEEYNIDYKIGDIKEQIDSLQVRGNEKFFKDMIFFINLIFQIRNTNDKSPSLDEQDFILSPVYPFFDSRISQESKAGLPRNGDENGSYNIARKGVIILKRILEWKNKNSTLKTEGKKVIDYPELYISNIDWDTWLANYPN